MPGRLATLAVQVRQVVAAYFTANGGDMPARQFVCSGPPAFDCALFAVQVELTSGHSGSIGVDTLEPLYASPGHAMRYARIALWLIRDCQPTVDDNAAPPAAAAMEAAAVTILDDADLMLAALLSGEASGEIPNFGDVAFESWQNIPTEGGTSGGVFRFRANIAGW